MACYTKFTYWFYSTINYTNIMYLLHVIFVIINQLHCCLFLIYEKEENHCFPKPLKFSPFYKIKKGIILLVKKMSYLKPRFLEIYKLLKSNPSDDSNFEYTFHHH